MSTNICPVTKDNWQELIMLKVREDQKHFVGSNLYSIAEAQFGFEENGHWNLHPFGIYDDDKPVGFLMYGYNFERSDRQAYIFRLMIDEKYQGKGYGRFAMQSIIEIFRTDIRVKQVGISYKPNNEVARRLYANLGFVEPGEMIGEEVLAILNLH